MIHAPCHQPDNALHFEREHQGGQFAHGQSRARRERVDLLVVVLFEQGGHGLLGVRQFGEERALNSLPARLLHLGVVLPSHGFHEVVGRRYQGRLVVAYQVVAALRTLVAHASGEGEHVAPVARGYARRDERAAVPGALRHHRGVRHARHDAVAAQEVQLVGVGAREVFGQQSILLQHQLRRVLVAGRVEVVKPVGQHGHGVKAASQGLAVRADVYAVSQAADDERVRAQLGQPLGERAHAVLPVGGAPARAHDVDDAAAVEPRRALEEQHERGVGAVLEPLRVVAVAEAERLHAAARVGLHLALRPAPRLAGVGERVDGLLRAVGHYVAQVAPVVHHRRGAARRAVELHRRVRREVHRRRQREDVQGLVHISLS